MRERRLTGSLKVSDQAGRRNVGGLRYKRVQPEPDANAPPRGVRGRSHSPDWKRNMPSTRTPDRPAGHGQDALPVFPAPRLIAVPAGWPPFDCETHGPACPSAREPTGAAREPAGPSPHAGLAPGRGLVPAGPSPAFSADHHPVEGAAAAAWPRQFAQVIVEVLAGSRSPRQLVSCTTERVRAQIDLLSQALAAGQRPRIRRIMTSRPAARVVEMTVVISFGPRSRALAMRFEHLPARRPAPGLPARPARWLCTAIEPG